MIQSIFNLKILSKEPQNEIAKLLETTSSEVKNIAVLTINNNSEFRDGIIKAAFTTQRCVTLFTNEKQLNNTILRKPDLLILLYDVMDTVSELSANN